MQLSKKIKAIRRAKTWTQEDMAGKLGISTQAYGKIERGKTNVNFPRLEQIADVLEIELSQLLGLDEKNVFNIGDQTSTTQCKTGDNNLHVNSPSTNQTEYKHQLEKAQLIIEQQDKENAMLKQQISDLRDMINMLKTDKYNG